MIIVRNSSAKHAEAVICNSPPGSIDSRTTEEIKSKLKSLEVKITAKKKPRNFSKAVKRAPVKEKIINEKLEVLEV